MDHVNESENNFTILTLNIYLQELAEPVFLTISYELISIYTSAYVVPVAGNAPPLAWYLGKVSLSVIQTLYFLWEAFPKLAMGCLVPLDISSTYLLAITCHFLLNDYCHYLFFMGIRVFLTKFQTLKILLYVLLGWTRFLIVLLLPRTFPEIRLSVEGLRSTNHN